MKQFTPKNRRALGILSAGLLAAFVLWTALLTRVDVRPIGPNGSTVGMATLTAAFHRLTGVHITLYTVTDWLGLVPVAMCVGFGTLGLVQWIRRKRIGRVDRSLLALGCFYVAVLGVYLLFEKLEVNYRPVLIDGCLEASYPSSTTLLTLCVMPTAATQLWGRIKRKTLRCCVVCAILGFTLFMVVARLVSGVHWLTDILGGVLLSGGLVAGYEALR
jgi:undecaprenyl-diphosphatase